MSLDYTSLVDVIRLLVTLHWLCFNEAIQADVLAKDLEAAANELKMDPPAAGWPAFTSHLVSLLQLDTLRVTSKAAYVAYQYPRHLHKARVFTDARPVYSEAVPSGPTAFIITHSLQLQVHDDGADKDYYVTLDGSDLHDLREVIERAIEKEKSLEGRLNNARFSIIRTQEQSE
ncbi:MAG: hypothetical protein SF187_04070 [Deltaproteobacteria bacterium]|nr:hypothetical protein [Deltaproteobacteria bacterium]